jgi:hypothetical protein
MMQGSLFTQNQLKKLKVKKPKRVWTSTDLFPFGIYKGITIGTIANLNPGLLEWWIKTKHVHLSDEILQAIKFSKFLSR